MERSGNKYPLTLAALFGIGLCCSASVAIAAESQPATPTADEQALLATVNALQTQYGASRTVVELNPHEAAMQALERNLSVQRGRNTSEIAQQALLEAKAVFDPVLNFAITHERTKRSTRVETDLRYQSATTVDGLGRNVLDVEEFVDPRAPLVVFTNPRNEGFVQSDIVASQKPLTGTEKRNVFDVSLE